VYRDLKLENVMLDADGELAAHALCCVCAHETSGDVRGQATSA
jgi:hypothetical protein